MISKNRTKIESIKPIQDLSEQFNTILNFIKEAAGIDLNKLIDEEINENKMNEEVEIKKKKKILKKFFPKKDFEDFSLDKTAIKRLHNYLDSEIKKAFDIEKLLSED